MSAPDVLTWIRNALGQDPAILASVEPVLARARQTYGGDTVYIRAPERQKVTQRTLQRRRQRQDG